MAWGFETQQRLMWTKAWRGPRLRFLEVQCFVTVMIMIAVIVVIITVSTIVVIVRNIPATKDSRMRLPR